MKIVFLVYGMGSGGAERTISYLTDYMIRKGWDVTVLSLTNELFYKLNDKIEFISLNISSESKNIFDKVLKFFKRKKGIIRNIKSLNPDVVFCMIPHIAKYIIKSKILSKKILVTSERNNPNKYNKKEFKKIEKILNKSDGVIFQTAKAKECYNKTIQQKSIVINNAVGNDYVFSCNYDENKVENKITAIGRLEPQKDYFTLINAFEYIKKYNNDCILEIFGEGSLKDELISLVKERGLTDNIIFKGVHKDAIVEASHSLCYVLSSQYEGMPNTLLEAMGAGIPCVSTDCPFGPSELIINKKNGLLVPVNDYLKLGKAVLRMVEDRKFALKCGLEAKKILETHTIEYVSESYCNFIEKLVN